jgi:hypothetical protein
MLPVTHKTLIYTYIHASDLGDRRQKVKPHIYLKIVKFIME